MRARKSLEIAWQQERIVCEIHRSGRGARNMTLRVRRDGSVRVGAPRWVGLGEIRTFVESHVRWILMQRHDVLAAAPRYVTGAAQLYLGQRLRLVVGPGTPSGVVVDDRDLHVIVPDTTESVVRDRLRRWYRDRAQEVLTARCSAVSASIGWLAAPPAWRQRRMRRQWGNCSQEGDITFNTHLVKAPPGLIDYVILHELCHLRHLDHGRGFQRLMDAHMPDWRERRRALNAEPDLLAD